VLTCFSEILVLDRGPGILDEEQDSDSCLRTLKIQENRKFR